ENPCDRAARSNARNGHVVVEDCMNDSGAESAEQIEYKVREVAKPILDIVAENPQVPHVPDQMQPAAVQKHGRQEGQADGAERKVGLRPSKNGGGDNAVVFDERLQTAAEGQLINKDQHIGNNDRDVNNWK